jgi:hypothetical protein
MGLSDLTEVAHLGVTDMRVFDAWFRSHANAFWPPPPTTYKKIALTMTPARACPAPQGEASRSRSKNQAETQTQKQTPPKATGLSLV